jgi:hypothetical protein
MLKLAYSLHEDGINAGNQADIDAFDRVVDAAGTYEYSLEDTLINIYQHQDTGGLIYLPARVEFYAVADIVLPKAVVVVSLLIRFS